MKSLIGCMIFLIASLCSAQHPAESPRKLQEGNCGLTIEWPLNFQFPYIQAGTIAYPRIRNSGFLEEGDLLVICMTPGLYGHSLPGLTPCKVWLTDWRPIVSKIVVYYSLGPVDAEYLLYRVPTNLPPELLHPNKIWIQAVRFTHKLPYPLFSGLWEFTIAPQ